MHISNAIISQVNEHLAEKPIYPKPLSIDTDLEYKKPNKDFSFLTEADYQEFEQRLPSRASNKIEEFSHVPIVNPQTFNLE